MRRTTLAAALIAAAALCACGRSQDATSEAPPAPADAPVPAPTAAADFAKPLNAIGTEPFWSVTIRPEGLTFSAPDMADITAAATAPTIEGATARWSATGSDGLPLTVALTLANCSDGMSDTTHPFTAAVQAGGRALKGCATYATSAAPTD